MSNKRKKVKRVKTLPYKTGNFINTIHFKIDRLHVGTPDREIVREVLRAIKQFEKRENGKLKKQVKRGVINLALKKHRANGKLYTQVMTGRF